jgi:ATP-dependent Clp protease adaptor protein ClpS
MSPATETPVRKPRAGDPGGGLDAPWQVIVLNDDHNTFEGVAQALSSVLPGVSFEQGMSLANRIHTSGRAVVWSGHKEQAELYWEQLNAHGLTMAPLDRV